MNTTAAGGQLVMYERTARVAEIGSGIDWPQSLDICTDSPDSWQKICKTSMLVCVTDGVVREKC